ncbi:MAG: response regulator [Treponema sp.]|jgi:two-component system chemotaxis response regulator CheY|nr:response regulator [Treponema sp.]
MNICALIVDDSEIMRKHTKMALADFVKEASCGSNIELTIAEASNGKEALKKLMNNPINLVLLDWSMPELSGIDFLKTVRTMEAYKSLPVIMITGEKDKTSVIEALKYGASDYMVKPIDRQLFIEKLFTVFNLQRSTGKK